MAPSTRILVVADDGQVGRWLQHLIDAMGFAGRVEVEDTAAFERRAAAAISSTCDLLLAALDFSPAMAPASYDWIDRTLAPPGAPPLVVVADNGDELAA